MLGRNMKNKFYDWIVFLVVTVGGIGKIKYAPGTFGSLAAYPFGFIYINLIIYISFFFIDSRTTIESYIIIFTSIVSLFVLSLFIFGLYSCKIYLKDKTDLDPKEVVIDELVGQLLTLILCSITFIFFPQVKTLFSSSSLAYAIIYLLLPFIFFRFFDIYKPWPIGWIDKNVKGALGVMLDDIAASILASIIHWSLVLIMIDFVKR
jgi:phosphatidylglycerophosphatase A